MGRLREKVFYLKGLADGMEMSAETREGKLLIQIIEALEEFSVEIERIDGAHQELSEYVDTIDEDLTELETAMTEREEEESGCKCGKHKHDEDDDDDEEDEGVIQLTCPHCEEEIVIKMDDLDEDSDPVCPKCEKTLFPEE